jgi:hypothetical protein
MNTNEEGTPMQSESGTFTERARTQHRCEPECEVCFASGFAVSRLKEVLNGK